MKNKNIVCVFAHPDDEAFGPSGIIANWAINNNVNIICVTDGSNPNSGIANLARIRELELKKSASILGVKNVYFLGYVDGELRNNIYHKVSADIEKILLELEAEILLTFEPKGVSGHIDHVFVTLVTSYLFKKLEFVKKLYYWCLPKLFSDNMNNYFIFCPVGYEKANVDHVENVTSVWKKKIKAIESHESQNEDGQFVKKMLSELPKEELFLVSLK